MTADLTLLAAETVYRTSTAEAVMFWVLAVLAVLGAVGVVAAPKAVYSAIFLAMHDDHPGGALHRPGRAVPRRRAGGRLHRRGDDAVPVRADADRRGLRRSRWWKPFADNASPRSRRASAFGILLIAGIGNVSVDRVHRAGRGQRRRQRRRPGGADLHPLPVGVRTDQRAADHRRTRRDGAGAPGALRPPQDPARAGHRAVRPRRAPHARCPAPASTPGTTRSTCRPGCPTARTPRLGQRILPRRIDAVRRTGRRSGR